MLKGGASVLLLLNRRQRCKPGNRRGLGRTRTPAAQRAPPRAARARRWQTSRRRCGRRAPTSPQAVAPAPRRRVPRAARRPPCWAPLLVSGSKAAASGSHAAFKCARRRAAGGWRRRRWRIGGARRAHPRQRPPHRHSMLGCHTCRVTPGVPGRPERAGKAPENACLQACTPAGAAAATGFSACYTPFEQLEAGIGRSRRAVGLRPKSTASRRSATLFQWAVHVPWILAGSRERALVWAQHAAGCCTSPWVLKRFARQKPCIIDVYRHCDQHRSTLAARYTRATAWPCSSALGAAQQQAPTPNSSSRS